LIPGPDHLPWLDGLLAEAAVRELMPRFGRLGAAEVAQKTSAFDVVTAADEACEAAITQVLRARHPGALVVGEEAAGRDPGLLDALAEAELAFVLDPLDGTWNFAAGLPLFGVMLAVVSRGQVLGSVIHDPVSRSSALAWCGQGAWHQGSGGERRPLRVAPVVPVAQMQGVVATNFLPEPQRSTVNGHLSRLSMTNWFRCAAHEYRLGAAGQVHVLFYNKLMPWDHAAGWLLHQEAGGYSAHLDGSAYRPFHTSGGLLCTPDEASWHVVRRALFED